MKQKDLSRACLRFDKLEWCFATPDANRGITALTVSYSETIRGTNHFVIRTSLRDALSK